MKRRTPFRSRLSAAARPAFDRNRAGHRPAVVKTAQHSDGSGGHVRDCYPSMAARAAFPVIVDDSLPAILRYSRSDRRRSVANRAQWSTGIVVIARLRQQSRVRGASSLGLIRHCGGNGVIHGDLPWGWAGAQPVFSSQMEATGRAVMVTLAAEPKGYRVFNFPFQLELLRWPIFPNRSFSIERSVQWKKIRSLRVPAASFAALLSWPSS